MKLTHIILILSVLLTPTLALGNESIATDRLQISIEDNGNWQLTDNLVNITWHGEWITEQLMRVTGSDNSCFIISENQDEMVQLDCQNLKEISILLAY
jgi:hypothetical protein